MVYGERGYSGGKSYSLKHDHDYWHDHRYYTDHKHEDWNDHGKEPDYSHDHKHNHGHKHDHHDHSHDHNHEHGHNHQHDHWHHHDGWDSKKSVCRDLQNILNQQKKPVKHYCGCTESIRQLKSANQNTIIPLMLETSFGDPHVEWGKTRHHHSYATVFFAVIKVNCRKNDAVLELLKPNKSIVNPHTGRVDFRKIKDVDFVRPTGERVYVSLDDITEVKRLPTDFVKR